MHFPNFITAKMMCERLQARLNFAAGKMRAVGCTNALIIVTDASINEKDKKVDPGDIQYSKDHCPNDRRNGSKFCQQCSDKHNGVSTNNKK